jgi:hypothetical protein
MKIGVHPESMLERLALAMGQVPIPIAHSLGGSLLARAVITAVRLDLFEALRSRALTEAEVASACGTQPAATGKLLDALVASGYLARRGSFYQLAPMSRKWLLKESPTSLHDAVLYHHLEWSWLGRLEEFVRTGRPLHFHASMSREEWGLYQRGMHAIATLGADELAQRVRGPRNPRAMLDIGGSHGYYAVALCRRHHRLRAIVFDLPEAIEHAGPILAREAMRDRVVHQAGNVLTDDLGTASYDLVLIAQLLHHFDAATNRDLVERAARALRSGGALIVLEAFGGSSSGGQVAGLLDLYFAFTSRAGVWSLDDVVGWQRTAGLKPQPLLRLRRLPHFAAQVAVKKDP